MQSSIVPVTAIEVGQFIAEIGDDFVQCSSKFVASGCDRTLAASGQLDSTLENCLNISSSFHRHRIIHELEKVMEHTSSGAYFA